MRRLAEGVYERDGRKVVKWWEPDGNGGGSRRQETLPEGTTLAEAKTFKGEMEKRKQRRGGLRRDTCDGFAKRWTVDYPRPELTTNMHNRERVSKFGEDFAGRDLRQLDEEDAHRWALNNRGRLKAVKAMFNDAVKFGYADTNPFLVVKAKQQRGRAEIVVLTDAEINRLCEIALDRFEWFGPVVAGMIGTAAWTGMRPGELFALRWDRVDFKAGEIHVLEQLKSASGETGDLKTHEQRTIALLPQVEDTLKTIPRVSGSDLIFNTKRGQSFNSRAWHYYWNPVRTAFWAGLPANRKAKDSVEARRMRRIPADFDFYELRHYFASYLANELHATPYDIATQMGHADGGKLALRLYVHTEQSDSNERMRKAAREQIAAAAKKRKAG